MRDGAEIPRERSQKLASGSASCLQHNNKIVLYQALKMLVMKWSNYLETAVIKSGILW